MLDIIFAIALFISIQNKTNKKYKTDFFYQIFPPLSNDLMLSHHYELFLRRRNVMNVNE